MGLPSLIAENMDAKAAALLAISGEAAGRAGFRRLLGDFDLAPASSMISLERETTAVAPSAKACATMWWRWLLNDKQLFGNTPQVLQDKLDLFDANRLAQVGVDHQYAV